MSQEQANFLGGTPPHIVLVLGLLMGVVGTIVISSLFNGAESARALKNNDIAAVKPQDPSQIPNFPQQPTFVDIKISDTDYIRGNKNAKIDIIEFSDFECPFCARHAYTIDQILQEFDGKVRFTYKHFPLHSIHPNAQKAAEASECAGEQGKFWEMHDELFELTRDQMLTLANMKQAARDLGLNTAKFNECLDTGKMAMKVNDDLAFGSAIGVNGTPGTFINGQLISGAVPIEQLRAIINSELAQ